MTNQTLYLRRVKYDTAVYLNNGNPKNKALGYGYGLIDDLLIMNLISTEQAEIMKRRFNYWLFNLYKPKNK